VQSAEKANWRAATARSAAAAEENLHPVIPVAAILEQKRMHFHAVDSYLRALGSPFGHPIPSIKYKQNHLINPK